MGNRNTTLRSSDHITHDQESQLLVPRSNDVTTCTQQVVIPVNKINTLTQELQPLIPTYTKAMTVRELQFLQHASNANIAPRILNVKQTHNDWCSVTMERYDITILSYFETGNSISLYEDSITNLVDKLHSLHIVHGDLHASNIVLNLNTDEIRLIDFGASYYMHEITEYELCNLEKFLDQRFITIEDLLIYEKVMYKDSL